jgi:putative membrane-bound dehydrogenase-like protein
MFALSLGLRASEFPAPYNTEPDQTSPMPAAEAAARMKLPPGFKATVFAAEPDVQNPIAMNWDARGRLWVVENYTYAERQTRFDLHLRDRILIFEDNNGDGHFSSRKVFRDDLQMVSGVAVGYGGVWVICLPRLLFFPDHNGDDMPDGEPEVVLDGFTVPADNYHTFANGLSFGPDGWLYGRCGASSPGEIGAPGTPAGDRTPLRGTMWRYHPQRKIFENLTSGTTNPWGHDWNEEGELFFINTVNGHLWHDFAGAHYVRPHTIDPNAHTYSLIDQHADHWHFDTSQDWSKSRDGAANAYGGGHAHVGMMIYLGDNWPEQYRGRLFTLNLHGRRANQEILDRLGSGYVGHHGTDFLIAADPWFRGMDLSYGPDGGVFVLDWSDTGECHESTGVHRTSGRIFKITYNSPKPVRMQDLRRAAVPDLVNLQLHPNEWFARQARLELTARAADGRVAADGAERLRRIYDGETNGPVILRALWTLYGIGAADQNFLREQLHHSNEHVRAWAIRLLTDSWPLDIVMSQRPTKRPEISAHERDETLPILCRLAREDNSGLVRLALASTLQRLPIEHRAELASALVSHREDANDHNLPLLIWYGLIPVADQLPSALVPVAENCELPLTRQYIARRLAEDIESNPAPLNRLLGLATSSHAEAFVTDILAGLTEALTGWRKASKPDGWDALARRYISSTNSVLLDRMRDLSVVFGDGRALDQVRKIALDPQADLAARKAALRTLIEARPADLRPICERLLRVMYLNPMAAQGLASFDDSAIGTALANAYRQFHPAERAQLISVLVSRPSFARELLDAIGAGRIPRADLSAFHVRQIRGFNDPALNAQLQTVWGELRESSADKRQAVSQLKSELTSSSLARADLGQGRLVFSTTCASCHRLYGEGADIGPDLTGAGRDNLDYLLENIVDPSAVVSADFRMSVVQLKDDRVLNGYIRGQTERTITVQTMTDKVTLERSDISSIDKSVLSLMPDGLLEALKPSQVRDLIAYLMHPTQVPLPVQAASNSK